MKADTQAWLNLAEEDLRVCRLVGPAGLHGPACFHAQQCAEKALKAILEERSVVRRVHALAELRALVEATGANLVVVANSLIRLDRFYMPTRYPLVQGALAPGRVTAELAAQSIADAEAVLALCLAIVQGAAGQ